MFVDGTLMDHPPMLLGIRVFLNDGKDKVKNSDVFRLTSWNARIECVVLKNPIALYTRGCALMSLLTSLYTFVRARLRVCVYVCERIHYYYAAAASEEQRTALRRAYTSRIVQSRRPAAPERGSTVWCPPCVSRPIKTSSRVSAVVDPRVDPGGKERVRETHRAMCVCTYSESPKERAAQKNTHRVIIRFGPHSEIIGGL